MMKSTTLDSIITLIRQELEMRQGKTILWRGDYLREAKYQLKTHNIKYEIWDTESKIRGHFVEFDFGYILTCEVFVMPQYLGKCIMINKNQEIK